VAEPRAVAYAISAAGYRVAQLNLKALGLPTLPTAAEWQDIDPVGIRRAFEAAGVACWGLSASYNMAHPDARVRRAGTLSATDLLARAPAFGVTAVTLCTGSRDPERMWAAHPDNPSAQAWHDMRAELSLLLAAAHEAGVLLGIEPEPGNVVRDADAAVRLLGELGADAARVGIIADAANLLAEHPLEAHGHILEHAFDALADHIVCLHAKDLVAWEQSLGGRGVVDYRLVASLYARSGLRAPVIVQDVDAAQAPGALAYLRERFADAKLTSPAG